MRVERGEETADPAVHAGPLEDLMGQKKRSKGAKHPPKHVKRAWKDALKSIDVAFERLGAKASAEIETLLLEARRDADAARDSYRSLVHEAAASSRSALDQVLDSNSRLVRQVETRAVEVEERFSAHELAVKRCAEHAEETIASTCATFADSATEAAAALNDRVRIHADTCSTIEGELREELQRIVERIRSDTERAIVDTRIDSRRSRSSSVSIVAEAETPETAAPTDPMVGARLGSLHTDSAADSATELNELVAGGHRVLTGTAEGASRAMFPPPSTLHRLPEADHGDEHPRTTRRAPSETVAASRRVATTSVSVRDLAACLEMLGRSGTNTFVRVEVRPTPADAEHPARVRLLVYDAVGWWEWYDIPALTKASWAEPTVVALSEFSEAVASVDKVTTDGSVELQFDGNLAVANDLLFTEDLEAVPRPPTQIQHVEGVEFEPGDRRGIVLESQLGRFVVPARLVDNVCRRGATHTSVVTADGLPLLLAHGGDSASVTVPKILARLFDEVDSHELDSLERRSAVPNEAAQLVAALSATTPDVELEQLLRVGVGYVRRRVAAHPSLPKTTIAELIATGTEAMRAAAASNVSIGHEALQAVVSDASPVVRGMAAANPAAGDQLDAFVADPDPYVRARAATNPMLSAAAARQLAADPNAVARAAVAARTDIEPELLAVLARDADLTVCAAVASNPACATSLLDDLVGIVPIAVLASSNASEALLLAGALIDQPHVRLAVASNPTTPPKCLGRLARDNDDKVLRAVIDHPRTPAGARRRATRRLDGAAT